jgi:hypothetical protein
MGLDRASGRSLCHQSSHCVCNNTNSCTRCPLNFHLPSARDGPCRTQSFYMRSWQFPAKAIDALAHDAQFKLQERRGKVVTETSGLSTENGQAEVFQSMVPDAQCSVHRCRYSGSRTYTGTQVHLSYPNSLRSFRRFRYVGGGEFQLAGHMPQSDASKE